MLKLVIRAIAIVAPIAIAFSSFAAMAADVYKDVNGSVYISGLGKGETLKVAYQNIPNKITVKTSGTCSLLKLHYRSSGHAFYPWLGVNVYNSGAQTPLLSFTGKNLPMNNLTGVQLCSGASRNPSLKWAALSNGVYGLKGLKDGEGRESVYLVGLPSNSYDATDSQPALRLLRANTCGYVKLSDTNRWSVASLGSFYFQVGENDPTDSYDLNSLPVKNPDFCKNGQLYTPG